MKIALLAPKISKYREPFYNGLAENYSIDFFAYENADEIKKQNMEESEINPTVIHSVSIFAILRIYSITKLINSKYKILILPAEIRSLSTWLLLLLKNIFKKKIILWGHGISVKNYLKEEANYPYIKKIFHNLADIVWLYTEKEKRILQKNIDKNKIIVLNNTLDIEPMLNVNFNVEEKNRSKKKYNISTEFNFIFSARFSSPYRRVDLLLEIIENLDPKKYGFIVIGDGKFKPNFKRFTNVYDLGAVYDRNLKNELFSVADLYLQPGWLGLSVVEALSYGKPIFTLKRTDEIRQGVEYIYIKHHYNGYIAKDVNELLEFINNLKTEDIIDLQEKSKEYAKNNLSMNSMINSAVTSINSL